MGFLHTYHVSCTYIDLHFVCINLLRTNKLIFQIVMNQDLLYVLTGRGLEIYTSRCGAVAVHHTDRFNTKEKVYLFVYLFDGV